MTGSVYYRRDPLIGLRRPRLDKAPASEKAGNDGWLSFLDDTEDVTQLLDRTVEKR